jgi:hypothetical protein
MCTSGDCKAMRLYDENGNFIANTITEASRVLGVSRQTIYETSEECGRGRQLLGKIRPVGRPLDTWIVFPDGQKVLGWQSAEKYSGVSSTNLRERSGTAYRDGAWHIGEVQKGGRPVEAWIVFPDGQRVLGWKAAEELSGFSLQALYRRAGTVYKDGEWYIGELRKPGRPRVK